MTALTPRITAFAAALWWGSLTAIGFLAVPLLFRFLPTPALAGNMAAQLFAAQTWVSVACGLVLLLCLKKPAPGQAQTAPPAIIFVVMLGMLLALLVEYAVAPRIVARQDLRLWHSVGTLMYAGQWLCAGAVLWRLAGAERRQA